MMCVGIFALVSVSGVCAQLRVVSYNTATGESGGVSQSPRYGLDSILQAIGNETVGDIQRPIDILALQEQSSSATTTAEIVTILNGIYGPGTYDRARVDGNTWGAGRPGLIYNTQTVQLIDERAFGPLGSDGGVRQNLRYQLRPVGYDSNADFYVYNSHYKASTGAANEARRNVEATTIRRDADSLGDGAHVIYLGDFNIKTSDEPMYQTLLGPGNGQAFDPISSPGEWSNAGQYAILHTQSPADGSVSGLITGGVDDRFDFQIVTGEVLDGRGFDYLDGSYRVFGNNGTHGINNPINSFRNTAQPTAILDALATVTDHLPVVADYQLPGRMAVTFGEVPSRIIQGANASVVVGVANDAPVSFAAHADVLDFLVTTIGGVQGTILGSVPPLSEPVTDTVSLNSQLLGTSLGRIVVQATSQGSPGGAVELPIDFDVVLPAEPSIIAPNLLGEVADLGIVPIGNSVSLIGLIQNLVPGSAALDLDRIESLDTSDIGITLQPFTGLPAGGVEAFQFQVASRRLGEQSMSWELHFSDEDIPGEAESTLRLSATATIALPGDANLDGVVDGSDFNIWNAHRDSDQTTWVTGDFNRDHRTDESDLELLSKYLFRSASEFAAVPEPASITPVWMLLVFWGVFRRRLNRSLTRARYIST